MSTRSAGKSRMKELHAAFAEMLINEMKEYTDPGGTFKAEGIPMAAADKTVIMTFLKHNEITCEPDDDKLKGLHDEFRAELEANRKARAERLTKEATGDGVDFLLQ